jgi:hypothetical protein
MLPNCYGFFHVLKPLIRVVPLLYCSSVFNIFARIILFFHLSIKYNIMHGFTLFYVPQKLKPRHTKLFVMATASLNLPLTVGAQGNEVS